MAAAGATTSELEQKIQAALAVHYRSSTPTVTIIVKETSGNQIFVLGKVQAPGSFAVGAYTDILQVLSLAGGVNEFARVGDIHVIRRRGGEVSILKFDYRRATSGRARAKGDQTNIVLQSGDIVVVP